MTDSNSITPDRLLLVDDNPNNLQVLFGAFEQEGYELLIAQSGEEALRIAREARPQLILLDINMPGMDGYQTCEALKSDPQTRNSVVIFLSARGDVADKVRGLELGAVDYVEKPFQFEEVVARVHQHLATYHQHRKLSHENKQLKGLIDGGFRELNDEDVLVLISEGESDRVEFKSTMRWNLHSNKPDKKIENACLKTIAAYLNSDGGFLLIGVSDEGQLLGLGSDDFASEDKLLLHWNGLLKQCLGVQVTPRVRSSILPVGGRRVLAVQCLPSSDPIFFHRDNEEVFYVRTGNGTQPLRPSEVLSYVDQRSVAEVSVRKSADGEKDSNRIGQYTLGELIGSGGMGSVFRGRHAMLHRPAAIKLLDVDRANEKTIERFQREVQLSSQLTHPNTITIYDYGRTSDGKFYYVMEIIEGLTLKELVEKAGPLPEGRIIHILQQVCGSLAEAHEAGLIHRDIKPANIMVSYRGGLGDFVKVLDFGLVRPIEKNRAKDVTKAGEFCGSPGYIPPESLFGYDDIDARADLYSLGATAWFLLAGRSILGEESSFEDFIKQVKEPAPRPSEFLKRNVDLGLETLIMQCLEKSPDKRPKSARILLDTLGNCRSASHWTPQKSADWWKQFSESLRPLDQDKTIIGSR